MRSSVRGVVLAGLTVVMFAAVRAEAQTAPDRPVGQDFFGKPLVITKLTAADVGALAAAAQVPMGFEAAPAGDVPVQNVAASGKTLRTVLDAIVAADPRYEWRDEDHVVVLRPAAAWTDRGNPLHRNVGPIRFEELAVFDALRIVVGMFGQELHRFQRDDLGEAARFRVDLPPGTVLEALNGLVRAHGGLTWGLEPWPPSPTAPGTVLSPFMVSLVRGGAGRAHGVGVHVDREPMIPELLQQETRSPQRPTAGVLDRVVGRKYNGQPLVLRGAYDLNELAYAARVPIGVELLAPVEGSPGTEGVTVTGMTVRAAVTALMALDPRYEWREFDDVIVVRPALAWTDPGHPLLRQTGPVHLSAVTVTAAINFQHSLLEPGLPFTPDRTRGSDPRRVTVTMPAGTHFQLLNAIARSHGELCWTYEELSERDRTFFGGRAHQLSIMVPQGWGHGFAFR